MRQDARYKIQDTRYKIQDTRYKIRDTRQDIGYKTGYRIQDRIQDSGYKIQEARCSCTLNPESNSPHLPTFNYRSDSQTFGDTSTFGVN
jgi:hypothetical protein